MHVCQESFLFFRRADLLGEHLRVIRDEVLIAEAFLGFRDFEADGHADQIRHSLAERAFTVRRTPWSGSKALNAPWFSRFRSVRMIESPTEHAGSDAEGVPAGLMVRVRILWRHVPSADADRSEGLASACRHYSPITA